MILQLGHKCYGRRQAMQMKVLTDARNRVEQIKWQLHVVHAWYAAHLINNKSLRRNCSKS